MTACRHFASGANRDRTGDLLLANPISALKVGDLQGFLVTGLGAKIGADARGSSAIIVVSGTFGDKCLNAPASLWVGAENERREGAQACAS
jgi:hypothetical protein